jgi:hypothetical protein
MSPMAFLRQTHSDKRFFQLLFSRLTPVLLLESECGFEIVTELAVSGKRSFLII